MSNDERKYALSARIVKGGGRAALQATMQSQESQQVAQDPMVTQAQAQAQAIMQNAQTQANLAREALRSELETQAHQDMARRLLELRLSLDRELGSMRPVLARIVRNACEKIIGIVAPEDALERCLEQAIRAHAIVGAVMLQASPVDTPSIQRFVQKWASKSATLNIQLIEDPSMPVGVCKLECEGLSVQLGVQPQLALLESVLSQSHS